MSKGKRKQNTNVHVNKYASKSKATEVMARLDAQERDPRQSQSVNPLPSSQFSSGRSLRDGYLRTVSIAEQRQPEKRYCSVKGYALTKEETLDCGLYKYQGRCIMAEHCIF